VKFKELQKLLNDVDSIKHGDDEILVLLPSSKRIIEFDIKSLNLDENHDIWYIEVEP
jgi:hypothetical protein